MSNKSKRGNGPAKMHVHGGATTPPFVPPVDIPQTKQIDILAMDNIVCAKCGHGFFRQVNFIKRIPGLLIGQPDDIKKVIPASQCCNCGTVLDGHKFIKLKDDQTGQ